MRAFYFLLRVVFNMYLSFYLSAILVFQDSRIRDSRYFTILVVGYIYQRCGRVPSLVMSILVLLLLAIYHFCVVHKFCVRHHKHIYWIIEIREYNMCVCVYEKLKFSFCARAADELKIS